MTQTLVGIPTPPQYRQLAYEWSGECDIVYAFASCDGLRLGQHRPNRRDNDEPMTDREWHLYLWVCLQVQIDALIKVVTTNPNPHPQDLQDLNAFLGWIKTQVALLRSEYGLETFMEIE